MKGKVIKMVDKKKLKQAFDDAGLFVKLLHSVQQTADGFSVAGAVLKQIMSYSFLINKNVQFKAEQFPKLKKIYGKLIYEDENSIKIRLGHDLSGKVVKWTTGQSVIFYKSVIKDLKLWKN